MSDNHFTLFFAWQSDTPNNIGRNFVENAAQDALKAIDVSGELECPVRLDKDTKGVPGTPAIADTIFRKIAGSSAFLADLTFIGTGGTADSKKLPNPNVLIELGYALGTIGPDRTIGVMNKHYGDGKDLPFDLRHRRWPLTYDLAPNASKSIREAAKDPFVKELKQAILAIATTMTPIDSRIELDLDKVIEEPLVDLKNRVAGAQFYGVPNGRALLGLVVRPLSLPKDRLPLGAQDLALRERLRPPRASGWDYRSRGRSFAAFAEQSGQVCSVVELTDQGVVSACTTRCPVPPERARPGAGGKNTVLLPAGLCERVIVQSAAAYLRILSFLGCKGPFIAGFCFFNLGESVLHSNNIHLDDAVVLSEEEIVAPPVLLKSRLDGTDEDMVAQAFQPSFDFLWREYGYRRSHSFDDQGRWNPL